jgi:hypothetical protein
MKYTFILTLAVLFLTSCNPITGPSGGGTSSTDIAYIWTAPYTDTYVSSHEPDRNFLGYELMASYNGVGALGPGLKTTCYVKFLMPILPQGAKVEEAYFEIFHGGKNEDGTTDDITFNVSEVGKAFRADTVTWNNGPDGRQFIAGLPVSPNPNRFRSQDWCSTPDISGLIQKYIDDPSTNHGFRITVADQRIFYKGFYSNNSFGRTATALGKAPRIVMKVTMPAGMASAQNISWPNVPADHDMKNPTAFPRGQAILISQYQFGGSDFPAVWNVKKNF